jgi:hypothetical protein
MSRGRCKFCGGKFAGSEDFGPMQVVEFFNSPDSERRAMEARRAFELVQAFLKAL